MKDQLSTSGTSFPIRLYHPARQAVMNAVGIGFMAVFLLLPFSTQAGALDSPAAPTVAGSAMFTITDIYNRLNTGATVTKRAGVFTEPTAAPTAGTGHTLDEVMTLVNSRAPVAKTGAKPISGYMADANEDIALQRGVARPNPLFTDNGDGTVTDNLTGLIWLKNANCAVAVRSWTTAMADVVSLNSTGTMNTNNCGDTAGNTDWRLPNVKELQSLDDFGFRSPALSDASGTAHWTDGNVFTGVVSSFYWSSTTVAPNVVDAWIVDFNGGTVTTNGKGIVSYYVWPVRGGLNVAPGP